MLLITDKTSLLEKQKISQARGFQEASGALRKERRPGRRGREAATRTAAPGMAHPDGPSGRSERRRNSDGCRTPGLLRGWREPLNPTACMDRLKLPTAWRAESARSKTVNTRRQAKYAPALRANSLKKNPPGKTTPKKEQNPTGGGFPEASAALRRERRPGRRGREAATRTAAPGRAHPDGPSGRSKRRRNSGGCRTPGLLRGWREPLNPTACTGRLKLPAAWRAEHTQSKTHPRQRRNSPICPATAAAPAADPPASHAIPPAAHRDPPGAHPRFYAPRQSCLLYLAPARHAPESSAGNH